ncbi:putative multidrug efflux protein [Roseibium sp. TrichSKD4]|uniref:hypothetical protein n=1 Tax=Roseibium sp. TrichSKD4 TaxID=744980 RepID=UPI0001E56FDB|nr:hypothetical protein [Roseibium sp. TrichSKD4]EFO31364.1 putative multidrug efflux protein [Roseibium sp. TrichSKD4]
MIDIDEREAKRVGAMIDRVKRAGLTEESDVFLNTYWAWLRIAQAYVAARPYITGPTGHVDAVMDHWPKLVPGTPQRDDAAVLQDALDDEECHRQEDRRLRREAGEEFI